MENTIQQVAATPLYFNWSFWAAIAAIVAIILSQIPPLYLLFKKAKLDIELYSRILVAHRIGNPNLNCHVILNNIGGRNLRVKDISARIERDGISIVILPAQSYEDNPNDINVIPLTSVTLKPKEEWGHIIHFLNFFNRSEEKDYKEAEGLLKDDIYKKRAAESNWKVLVKAEPKFVEPLLNMFEKMFIWEPGEYKLTLTISAEPFKKEIQKRYRFTFFESDSKELRKYTEDYDTGTGVHHESFDRHPGISVQITEEA